MGREIRQVSRHRANLCAAVTNYGQSYQVPWIQRCQQSGAHLVAGVLLCGTHFNAAARGPITVLSNVEVEEEDILAPTRDA